MTLSRRNALGAIGAGLPLAAVATRALAAPVVPPAPPPMPTGAAVHEPSAPPLPPEGAPPIYDKVGLEWVMDILPFCSQPEYMGSAQDQVASDGYRNDVWPIIGGVFHGRGIRGTVIPGGGDFPVVRPDGVVVVDALYRLKTDDGQQIIIHNKGLGYTEEKYRLLPTFEVPGSKYAWLRESVFVATLTFPIPPTIKAPDYGPKANGRLIQVFRMT
ncbi:DUF3237 family protein [Novosphingobium pokkalii]|uniref:DUF3237 family protein n=1 Tax=Novosphingobium pokkalii TaxID=1770194 RepID=A0ABV7V444_9SPHN|nr:DUF3237 family protein [Novosphingobium pokkalii]GHC90918.1 hypothetical protein GCM10019060_15390 [Novosphingobium pokkalii]